MKKTLLATTLIALSLPVLAQYKITFDNLNIKLPEPPTVESQYALSFDGMDDYVSCGNILSNTDIITFEFIVTPKVQSQAWTGVLHSNDANNKDGWGINFYNDPQETRITHSDKYPLVNAPMSYNTQQHIAIVDNNKEIKVYKDGVLEDTYTGTFAWKITDLNLGKYLWMGSNRYFDGIIDEIRIWNRERTQADIQDKKNKELTGNETGLLAYYKLDSGSGSTVIDSAGSNNCTINGATWVEE